MAVEGTFLAYPIESGGQDAVRRPRATTESFIPKRKDDFLASDTNSHCIRRRRERPMWEWGNAGRLAKWYEAGFDEAEASSVLPLHDQLRHLNKLIIFSSLIGI